MRPPEKVCVPKPLTQRGVIYLKTNDMTITDKEIRDDFERFIRHEAMRANTTQDEIKNILNINSKM